MVISSVQKIQDFYVFNVAIPALILSIIFFELIVFRSITWVLATGVIYVGSYLYGVQIAKYLSAVLTNVTVISDTLIPKIPLKDPCGVCSNDTCKRHKLLPHSTKVKVPKDFDLALQQLLEELLQTYVCTWYSDFSTNEAFVQQLRLAIATAAKNIAIRLLRANVSGIIFHELVPLALQHAHDWQILRAKAQLQNGNPREFAACYLGRDLHPAAYSRQAELDYLRGLVTALMPHLLPAIHISTNNKVILREVLANWILLPAVDALADPENVNTLITLSTHREGALSDQVDTVNVPMLQCWLTPTFPVTPKTTENQLKPTLDEIINDPQLLYMFMQHVKEAGPMNLFQFCLDIDDLSKRMLNPDLTPEAEEALYADVQNTYAIYLDPDGPEYLHLPRHISTGIKQILEGGPKNIQELRTSRPFYQAHQEAHALLEATCLPSFHHSYQLYNLLCGQLKSESAKRSQRKSTSSSSSNASSNISSNTNGSAGPLAKSSSALSKDDGVLRPSIETQQFQIHEIYQGEEDSPSRTYSDIKCLGSACNRDLTTWRVSVPHVDTGGNQPLYMIAVHSATDAKSWTVLRRDQEFYTLRTRLTEFHGDKELSDSPLPSRKNPHLSCSVNRQRYEDFLQKLLSKPVLRSSELLYTFLTTPNLKPYFANYSTPDIGILYQNMAYKLRKEKGQHLDRFMSTFLASTNSKYDYADVGVEAPSELSLTDFDQKGPKLDIGVFGNNLSVKNVNIADLSYPAPKRSHVKGACLCIADAVERLLSIPITFSRLLWMFASSLCEILDPLVNTALYGTLAKLLSGGRAAVVVKLLHMKIVGSKQNFQASGAPDTSRQHYESAKEGLHNLLPWWLMAFQRPWNKLTDSLLDPFQDAPLNKHIAYLLLDHTLTSLFPELTT